MIFFTRVYDEGTQLPNRAPQYVAIESVGDMIWSEFALDDAAGVGRLRARFPEAAVACSPELSQAAAAAGLPVAELPERERRIAAAAAVLVRHSAEMADVELSLLINLLEALARLERSDRWKEPAAAPVFEVVCAELQPHRWVARVLPLQPPMIALLPPGATYTIEGPGKVDFATSQRILALGVEPLTGRARGLLQRAFGLDHAPKLMVVFGNRLLSPSPREAALVAAAVNALEAHDGSPQVLRAHVGKAGVARLSLELRVVPPGQEPFEGQALPSQAPPRQVSLREAFEAGAARQNVPVVPRGAPCPCGSGEKYKRCHGANAPASGSGLPTEAELGVLERRLYELLTPEERALAQQQYPVRGASEIEDLARFYFTWLVYQFRPQGTETAAERYLRIHRKAMDVRVRTYLEAQRSGRVSVWCIQAVDDGWMQLEDAFGAGTFRVRCGSLEGAEAIPPGYAFLGRLFAVPGEVVLSALHPDAVGPAAVDALVRDAHGVIERLGLPRDHLAQPEADLTRLLLKPWHMTMSEPVKLELVDDEP
ncbi:MAG: SEC-C domain-containing protein [Deltaproteobacteria bacterium]|nr:SEC-C domain-containing protein [Deltaproteobacteria bacterium]